MLGQLRNEIGKRAVPSSYEGAADEELVAAAKNGDELGFESLAKRHQRRIFALAFRYTRVREDAEDIVQETFREAFVHLQKFEGKSSWTGVPDNHLSTIPVLLPHAHAMFRRQFIFIVFNSKESERSFK